MWCIINKKVNKETVVKQRRKEIKDIAKHLLIGKVLSHPRVPFEMHIKVSGIKEWLNQPHIHYNEKNEALLTLPELLRNAEYVSKVQDPKRRDYIVASHLFKTEICGSDSWIIVNETIWNECIVHSVSDNIPIKQEKQDF